MGVKNFIFLVLNWSFFLHVSCDDNFDTIAEKQKKRISLFHIGLGLSNFYFFTYDVKKQNFSLYYRLNYSDLRPDRSKTDFVNDLEKYKAELGPKKSELHDFQVDFLIEKKEDNKEAISSSYNKASFLLAFITTITGVFVYLLPIIQSYTANSIGLYIILAYLTFSFLLTMINAAVFIFEVLRVRGYLQCSYEEISKSKEENRVLLYHYFEWKAADVARVNKVGILKNAEKYSIRVFFFSIALWFFLQVFPNMKHEESKIQEVHIYMHSESDSTIKAGGSYETIFI